jgi:hypothetical protein
MTNDVSQNGYPVYDSKIYEFDEKDEKGIREFI